MFFRREKPRVLSFEERINNLKQFGFQTQFESAGRAKVMKNGCAAIVEDRGEGRVKVHRAGVMIGEEIGLLVDGGFQKFFQTPSGKRLPALAGHLKALHDFQEDLKEGLGLISLYNESLGTTCDLHIYDRVEGRDAGLRAPAPSPAH
jgi:hypothetical protein